MRYPAVHVRLPQRQVHFQARRTPPAAPGGFLEDVKSLVQGLRDDFKQEIQGLARAQAQASRPQLARPLLAAVDSILPDLDSHPGALEELRRGLRIADALEDTDSVVADFLPTLWQQALQHPNFSDQKLLGVGIENVPVKGASTSVSNRLQPLSTSVRSVTTSFSHSQAGTGTGTGYCYRCGRRDHTRGRDCTATHTANGEAIPPGQKARFAPATWKQQYGYDNRGFSTGKANKGAD